MIAHRGGYLPRPVCASCGARLASPAARNAQLCYRCRSKLPEPEQITCETRSADGVA